MSRCQQPQETLENSPLVHAWTGVLLPLGATKHPPRTPGSGSGRARGYPAPGPRETTPEFSASAPASPRTPQPFISLCNQAHGPVQKWLGGSASRMVWHLRYLGQGEFDAAVAIELFAEPTIDV